MPKKYKSSARISNIELAKEFIAKGNSYREYFVAITNYNGFACYGPSLRIAERDYNHLRALALLGA